LERPTSTIQSTKFPKFRKQIRQDESREIREERAMVDERGVPQNNKGTKNIYGDEKDAKTPIVSSGFFFS